MFGCASVSPLAGISLPPLSSLNHREVKRPPCLRGSALISADHSL
ncbi:hypothetical protein A2U01_0098569, partial [Trifolium medium]|nr:hypothetical protein [Trifolium medium]